MSAPALTGLGCPVWCDGCCRTCGCGDPGCWLLHLQEQAVVEGVNRTDDGDLNCATVRLHRQDTPNTVGPVVLRLDVDQPDLHLSPAAARELAAALTRLADQGEA